MSLALEDKNHLSNHKLIEDVFIFRLLYWFFLDKIMLLLKFKKYLEEERIFYLWDERIFYFITKKKRIKVK